MEYPKLQGNKVILREVRDSDIQHTVKWRNDPEFTALNMALRMPVTETMEKAWLSSLSDGKNKTKIVYIIEDNSDGSPVGLIILSGIDWIAGTAVFGISIGEQAKRGQGLGREAMELLLNYAFNFLNIRKITLTVVEFAAEALILYEKLGFRREGILKQQVYLNDNYYDVYQMALFKNQVRELRDERNLISSARV